MPGPPCAAPGRKSASIIPHVLDRGGSGEVAGTSVLAVALPVVQHGTQLPEAPSLFGFLQDTRDFSWCELADKEATSAKISLCTGEDTKCSYFPVGWNHSFCGA